MKLTKSKLKQLIKEALKEAMSPDSEKAAALERCADVINMKEDPTFREGACLATSGVRELLNK